jgi:hypothetical protein
VFGWIYSNSDPDGNAHGNCFRNSGSHSDRDCDCYAHRDSDAFAHDR